MNPQLAHKVVWALYAIWTKLARARAAVQVPPRNGVMIDLGMGRYVATVARGAAALPGLAMRIVSFPFRVIHTSYSSLAGPHRRYRELQRLRDGVDPAYQIALNKLTSSVDMGGIEVQFSPSYIQSFLDQYEVGHKLSTIKNPELPSFFRVGKIEDPFGISRIVISLDNRAVYVLTIIAIIAMCGVFLILMKVFTFAVRSMKQLSQNSQSFYSDCVHAY